MKIFKPLFIVLSILLISLAFCGCQKCEHYWQDATCTTPSMCLKCSEIVGTPRAHNWKDATTSSPKTCTLCGATEGEPLSAYEALNEDEKKVYTQLKKFASTLQNPASLKLIGLRRGKPSASATTEKIMFEISANNAYGSPQRERWYWDDEDNRFWKATWYDIATPWNSPSVSKINAALKEYFEDMGW